VDKMRRETSLLLVQLLCTVLGCFFSIILFAEAIYIGDFFCSVAICVGFLAIREGIRKKNWAIRVMALLLVGMNVFVLLCNHGLGFLVRDASR